MTPEQRQLLDRAHTSLAAAQLLYDHLFYRQAAAEAYYGMFYAAEAILLGDGLAFSKHHAVIAQFGTHYAKTGRIDPRYHADLRDAFKLRMISDYDVMVQLSAETAADQLARARAFVAHAEVFLTPPPRTEDS